MNDARTADTSDVLGGVVSPEVDHHPGGPAGRVVQAALVSNAPGGRRRRGRRRSDAAAYERGLADGQAGLTYQVPPARDGQVRSTRCYRHGYEHGAAIRARNAAA